MGWIADLLQEVPSAARYKAELEKLESDHEVLKADNAHLRAELDAAKLEIDELKQAKEVHGSDRPEIETQMLALIAMHTAMSAGEIAAATGQGTEAAQFHLDELFEARFVKSGQGQDYETVWGLNHEGRRYLIERGLMK